MKHYMKLFLFVLSCLFMACDNDDMEEILPNQPDEEQTEPQDVFVGKLKSFTLADAMEYFHSAKFVCRIQAEDGTIFKRKGEHIRFNNTSTLTFDQGLKGGRYHLLELLYPEINKENNDTLWQEYGLGCTIDIDIEESMYNIAEPFNKEIGFFGEGTAKNPFIISSGSHLVHLAHFFKSKKEANKIKSEMYFKQVCDIDMERASFNSDIEFGWLGIGTIDYPFKSTYDGDGFHLTGLQSTPINPITQIRGRDVFGAGLFAFTSGANIYHVHMDKVFLEGDYGIGSIVGCAMTGGDQRELTTLMGCSVSNSTIKGLSGSVGIGGLIGATDLNTPILLDSCYVSNTHLEGHYAVGGLFGVPGQYSTVVLDGCCTDNYTVVEAKYASAGGLVGAADSLAMTACVNRAMVNGGTLYKQEENMSGICTGGLVGGAATAHINACVNYGNINGYEGVGGLVGSSRLAPDQQGFFYLGEINIVNSQNFGNITGVNHVGGLCGEAQISGFSLLNEGHVHATGPESTVGGIVGNASACALHDVVNLAPVTALEGSLIAGGIVGNTLWASLYACQNFGNIDVASKLTGGIAGQAGGYSIINNCANYAGIKSNAPEAKIGGIAGRAGASRTWDLGNKLKCVMGLGTMGYSVVSPFVSLGYTYLFSSNARKENPSYNISNYSIVTKPIAPEFTYACLDRFVEDCAAEHLDHQLMAHYTDQNQQMAISIAQEVKDKLLQKRISYFHPNQLPDGITDNLVLGEYTHLQNTQFEDYLKDDGETVNHNINITRENRYRQVDNIEQMEDVVHSIVKGVSYICSGVLLVVSMPASSTGGAIYSIYLAASSANGMISGSNKMIASLTDYNTNADVISQCVNTGNLYSNDPSSEIGGIVGCLENYSTIDHCLNTGFNHTPSHKENPYQAGICGNVQDRSIITHNINVNPSWYYYSPIYGVDVIFPKEASDNYQYVQDDLQYSKFSTDLRIDELSKAENYSDEMEVGNDINGLWYLSGDQGTFPIPCRSMMLRNDSTTTK